jgi:energy-coupling factor transporter ATP-binding protein EcfA2
VIRVTLNDRKIVAFLGPVGVGKSTQINLLRTYLESRDQKVTVTYIKSTHGLTYVLSRLLNALTRILHNGDEKARIVFYRGFAPLWNLSETISITVKFLFTVYIPYTLGYYVLVEEGLIMTIENYRLFRPYYLGVKPQRLPLLELLLRWINSKNHLNILLYANEEDVAKRRLSRSFRRYETEDYLALQKQVFKQLRGPQLLVLNTTHRSIESVHTIIVNSLEDHRA